ncbi:MAG TPA: glycosyltransferase family 39 protein [Acidiferrobacteraceae bacterium]|nr:glycosyltransferase family 39 protein [Acidiferrobacteraceae bacterium]
MQNTPASSTSIADATPIILLRILLASAIGISFFFNIHTLPLFDLDEGAFSEATREMFLHGDFISTTLNGEPRYDKPILVYWLQALSTRAFGFSEIGFRLPSAIAASAWVLVIYGFVRQIKDERTGLYAGLMTATALQVSLIGRAAIADSLLNLFITVALFCIYLYYQNPNRRLLYMGFAAMGLGFLTKGPVAVLIPLVTSALFFSLRGRFRGWYKAAFDLRGLLLFTLIAAPWYGAQTLRQGQAFIEGFFFRHNLDRFQGPMEGHGGSLLYYLPVLIIGLLPFTAVLFKAASCFKQDRQSDLGLFLWCWFLFVLVFFSFSGTKLPHYIVYAYPAILILMATHIGHLRSRLWALLPAVALFSFLAALPALLEKFKGLITDPFVMDILATTTDPFPANYTAAMLTALAVTIYFIIDKRFALAYKLSMIGVVTVTVFWGSLMPVIAEIKQSPIKQAALLVRDDPAPIVMWRLNTPSFLVYSERLTEKRPPQSGDLVLTKGIYLSELNNFQVLLEKHGIALIKLL